ncbi:uncharacterized protein TM35_000054360 [Trypanosoma theileri]|uniref:Uncharacterized protein n=1 Tax=Trypanosoma theileri TaxID=67003 RepID=A0A1X0P5Y0_9TRYP|nr:uncharacterized protein TM35_000054360 [Trypanosoma theileri]ORC91840.1 hypothetical protein TM35_000054360 [Trypanosoma theileri]
MLPGLTPQQINEDPSAAEDVANDATVVAALLCNTSLIGMYRIQEHSRRRAKDMVEHGKMLGRLNTEKYRPLQEDVELARWSLHETVEGGRDALQRMHHCVGRLIAATQNTDTTKVL